jgi:hypothetical protein
MYGYSKNICDKLNIKDGRISYISLYNHEFGRFSQREYDYCSDCVVYDAMFSYLKLCGEGYMDQLAKDGNMEEREQISKTFRDTGVSTLKLIGEIERFLEKYEKIY